jgi:hypothetical protein
MKLWQGRFEEEQDPVFEKMNRSLPVDAVLLEVDVRASRAHARGLHGAGILNEEEWRAIDRGLESILTQYSPDEVKAMPYEDVHTFVEATLAEKVIAALKGNRSDRALLVRDPNRMVWSAVLGSPGLTDAEIESFSAMRNISDQALRRIGGDREWTKKYIIISNLVKNPRTPIGVSMTLVSRLTPRDLKAVVVDKNVPEAVRKHAEKFVRGPGGGGGGKH